MKTNKKVLFILSLTSMILLTGCQNTGENKNITLGMTEIGQLNYTDALSSFTTASEKGEDAQLILRGQGLAYLGLARYEDAKNSFISALTYSSYLPTSLEYDINYYLATAYYKLDDYDNAIKTYDAILNLDGKESKAYYLRGCVKLDNGDFDGAVKDFDNSVKLDKQDYELYINIYKKLAEKGYRTQGEAYLQTVIDSQDKNMTDYDKGRICYYLQDYENARNYLETARDENNRDIMLMLGQTYEALTDFNYAASVYSNYLASNPDAKMYNQLGLCKMHLIDYQGALEAFDAGLELEDTQMTQTLGFNEIVAYEYLGDFKKAAVLMETYLETYPEDENALREYDFLKTR